ncbi:MAG: alpha/beta fold hydrolase [Rhodobacteraceae bacterium]|nr:MAG: alpha/beta fold hydrolase [Paracoccaceae bacterium]
MIAPPDTRPPDVPAADAPVAAWDRAYANSAAVPDAPAIFAAWAARSAAFRETARGDIDVPCGAHPRERLDLFLPEGAPQGLAVFVHGGYWKAFDKSASSWLAAGPLGRGWAVAVPSYPLCPEARIAAIARSVARAVETAAARIAGPIALVGHSAGGQLVTRLIAEGSPLAPDALARVVSVVSISGVHDLRPLRRTSMNDTLRLDATEAAAESPALLAPVAAPRVAAWVGAAELPAFRRQTALLAAAWTGLGLPVAAVEAVGRHHFDVVDALADPGSALVSRLVGRFPGDR